MCFSNSGFACCGIRYKGVFSSLSWVLCVSFGQTQRLKNVPKAKVIRIRGLEISTSKAVSGTARTTVNTFPPNFIPLRPAQALRVTEWSTYWNGWNNYFKINERRKRNLNLKKTWEFSTWFMEKYKGPRGSLCNKQRYLADKFTVEAIVSHNLKHGKKLL